MKTASKTDSNLINHLLNTPSPRIVITAPRQSGATRGVVKMASLAKLENPNKSIAIIARNSQIAMVFRNTIKQYGCQNVDILDGSTIKKRIGDKCITALNGMSGHSRRNIDNYDLIFVDDAFWCMPAINIINENFANNLNVKIVLVTTGSNTEDWWKYVNSLTKLGYTSLITNPPRHPLFHVEMKAKVGFDGNWHHKEYELHRHDE
jgi:hypothetical protein